MDPLLDKLKFDANGLVPVIIQDVANGEVLVMAYTNREALEKTLASGEGTHVQPQPGTRGAQGGTERALSACQRSPHGLRSDAVLIKVVQEGGACHEGYRSCFFRQV